MIRSLYIFVLDKNKRKREVDRSHRRVDRSHFESIGVNVESMGVNVDYDQSAGHNGDAETGAGRVIVLQSNDLRTAGLPKKYPSPNSTPKSGAAFAFSAVTIPTARPE